MPEVTYVNTRFHTVDQMLQFATDFLHILEPISCIIAIPQSLYIAPLDDAGYHCSNDSLDNKTLEQFSQYLAFHNHSIICRNSKCKTTWTVNLLFPDAPHLRRLTEYHQFLNILSDLTIDM